ncbi:dihydrolipoyl dehydrogenase family protein [Bacillus sp. Marseille-P3800]|uniref:dihydrolipoyl dehydrogenase family protein n=1 Tax=Bacillus sp. Marseille-P3800 TaxID=2014782 RepID=UPI000C08BBD3|nr:NAD(P)/FAD-dependent oxidoreductase [Bacillus sp. Marseille-P3800]
MKSYDVIIIGSGPAAMAAAFPLAEANKKVAVIEGKRFGGTCPNFGCDPKKILYTRSEAVWQAQKLTGTGVSGEIEFNWEDAMQEKNRYTESVYSDIEQSMKDSGIDTYVGYATFIGEETIQVNDQHMKADHFIIATGLTPSDLPFSGSDQLLTHEDFLHLSALPATIAFIGAGYISFEFAHLAARAGVDVHIIDAGDRPLKAFDQDHVNELVKQSEQLGITFHWNASIQSVTANSDQYVIKTEEETVTVNKVVHGAGRKPNIAKLNLDQAGVETGEGGIIVDNTLRSVSNPKVYAAGDVSSTRSLPLTPLSGKEGGLVVKNILNDNKQELDQGAMPSVVFTIPKLARVGYTKEELDKQQVAYDLHDVEMTEWLTYTMIKEDKALGKVYIDQKTNQVLGAEFLTVYADQWVNYFSTAIQLGLKTDALSSVHFTYPSVLGDSSNLI